MRFCRTFIGVALALAAAAPAHAATDSVVATTARPTPLAADANHVLYSAWDGTSYRLTELGAGALPVAGADRPFTVDLGLGPDDHEVAVYPRCAHGCDLYLYDLVTHHERKLRGASSTTDDEVAGAVWRDRLVFSRIYGPTKAVLYTRSLVHSGASKRVAERRALSVDVRGTRVPFSNSLEWSNEPWLASTSGGAERLTRVPGSGAAVDFLDALNPTAYGSSIYWLLVREGDHNFTEIHRYNRAAKRDERVATTMPGNGSGFAYDAGTAYYAIPAQPGQVPCAFDHDCVTAIHRVDGLAFQPASPIELR